METLRYDYLEERNIALCIIFTLITCGIYGIYWFIKVSDELNILSGDKDKTGLVAFLLSLITCGIYGIYWHYQLGQKQLKAQRQLGMAENDNSIGYLIMSIFGLGIVAIAIMQSEINNMIRNLNQID